MIPSFIQLSKILSDLLTASSSHPLFRQTFIEQLANNAIARRTFCKKMKPFLQQGSVTDLVTLLRKVLPINAIDMACDYFNYSGGRAQFNDFQGLVLISLIGEKNFGQIEYGWKPVQNKMNKNFKNFLLDCIPIQDKNNRKIANLDLVFERLEASDKDPEEILELKAMLLIKLYGMFRSEQLYRIKVDDVRCTIDRVSPALKELVIDFRFQKIRKTAAYVVRIWYPFKTDEYCFANLVLDQLKRAWAQGSEWLFPHFCSETATGNVPNKSTMDRRLNLICGDFAPHTLRHNGYALFKQAEVSDEEILIVGDWKDDSKTPENFYGFVQERIKTMTKHKVEIPKYFNHHFNPANPTERITIPVRGYKRVASNGVDNGFQDTSSTLESLEAWFQLIRERIIRPQIPLFWEEILSVDELHELENNTTAALKHLYGNHHVGWSSFTADMQETLVELLLDLPISQRYLFQVSSLMNEQHFLME